MSEELHPSETVTTFLLLRHGHTEPTESGKLYNDPNVALTERGVNQAKALGGWLKTKSPDVLISSTAVRVRSTAEIIQNEIDKHFTPVEDLNEWSVGDWEGRTYLDLKKNSPDEYYKWTEDPITHAPPGGESIADLCVRIKKRMKELIADHEGKTVALVTHAGVIRAILMKALDIPQHNFWRLSIPAGSASRVDFSDNFATVHYVALNPEN